MAAIPLGLWPARLPRRCCSLSCAIWRGRRGLQACKVLGLLVLDERVAPGGPASWLERAGLSASGRADGVAGRACRVQGVSHLETVDQVLERVDAGSVVRIDCSQTARGPALPLLATEGVRALALPAAPHR